MKARESLSPWRFVIRALALLCIVLLLPRGEDQLDASEQAQLLRLAREQLLAVSSGGGMIEVDGSALPARLLRPGTAFVTLTLDGALRGCMVDSFEAHEPLYQNVLRNTILAASGDERFAAIRSEEVDQVRIAISVVGAPERVEFADASELLSQLEPGVDGVILTLDGTTSTYLPEVWERFPDPRDFLSQLCEKAGLPADRWREAPFPTIERYRTLRFEEEPRVARLGRMIDIEGLPNYPETIRSER